MVALQELIDGVAACAYVCSIPARARVPAEHQPDIGVGLHRLVEDVLGSAVAIAAEVLLDGAIGVQEGMG